MRRSRKLVLTWVRGHSASVGQEIMLEDHLARDLSEITIGKRHRGRLKACGTLADFGVLPGQFEARQGENGPEVSACEGDLRLGRQPVARACPSPGDVLRLGGAALLLCIDGHAAPDDGSTAANVKDFPHIVGEGSAISEVKRRLAFIADCDQHVLILGESGTGKELAAVAIHGASRRHRKKMLARSAATFPSGLVEAEFFGNVGGYPNPGMPERPGVIGEACGSTFFLDEIGEMQHSTQAHLLRVLDSGGEYHRLGDARAKRSDVRVIAATNRPIDDLKPDLAARFMVRVEMPPLRDRREDIPQLVQHLLRRIAACDINVVRRFCDPAEEAQVPRVSQALMEALLYHDFPLNVRELEQILWASLCSSRGDALDLTPEVEKLVAPKPAARPPGPPTPEEMVATLEQCRWKREPARVLLGLSSRFVLHRMMTQYDIRPPSK